MPAAGVVGTVVALPGSRTMNGADSEPPLVVDRLVEMFSGFVSTSIAGIADAAERHAGRQADGERARSD